MKELNFMVVSKKLIFDFETDKYSFEEVYKQILKEYEIKREKLFEDWKIPESIMDKLKKEIKIFINESYEIAYEKIIALTVISEFNFLNISFSFRNLIKETLNNISEFLLSQIDGIINKIYDKS